MDDLNDDETPATYHWPDVPPAQMASFFAIAARFYRARPWMVMPESRGPVGIDAPSLTSPHATVSVMGAKGQAFGVMVFDNLESMDAYTESMDAYERDETETLSPHMAMSFEPGSEILPELRREVGEQRWELHERQYPWTVVIDHDGSGRPPTSDELTRLEVVLSALATHAEALGTATGYRAPTVNEYKVTTHAGDTTLTLEDPQGAREALQALSEPFDVELTISEDEDLDALDKRLSHYSAQLLARFDASPERAALGNLPAALAPFLLDAAYDAVDGGVTHLSADFMRTFLYEMMPAHALVDPAYSAAVVDELRAFLTFLRRAHNVLAAEPCLAVLDHRVVPNLRKALNTRSLWSPDKKQAMRGLR